MDLMMLAVFCCFFCFENLRSLEVTSFEWYDDARESFEFAWICMCYLLLSLCLCFFHMTKFPATKRLQPNSWYR